MNKELSPLEALEDLINFIGSGEVADTHELYEYVAKRKNIVETALENYDEIEQMCKQYNIEFNLVNIRHALFTLAQLKGSNGTNWENYNRKLKALEIIKEKKVNVWCLSKVSLERYNNEFVNQKERHLTQEEYELLKEVLL